MGELPEPSGFTLKTTPTLLLPPRYVVPCKIPSLAWTRPAYGCCPSEPPLNEWSTRSVSWAVAGLTRHNPAQAMNSRRNILEGLFIGYRFFRPGRAGTGPYYSAEILPGRKLCVSGVFAYG